MSLIRERWHAETGVGVQVERTLLSFVALATIAMSAWVLASRPATGYEELYGAYPTAFWALLSLALVASAVVFLLSSITGSGHWKAALTLVCAIYVLFNLLPLLRGWALYGRGSADVLAHLGWSKVILRTGHLSGGDFYPVVHVLVAELALLGVPIRVVPPLFPAVFTVVYLLGVYLLSRRLAGANRIAVVTLAVAVVPLYGKFQHSFHPFMFSFALLPVFLFAARTARDTGRHAHLAASALLALTLVVFHPVTSLYAVAALAVGVAARLAYAAWTDGVHARVVSRVDLALIGFTSTAWLAWHLQFAFVRRGILLAFGVVEDSQTSVVTAYGAKQLEGARSLQQILTGFVDRYGPIFLVAGLAAVASTVVAVRLWRRDALRSEVWLASQFSAGVAASVFTIATYVIAYNPVRNSRYMILMATLLAGLLLYWLVHETLLEREWLQRAATVCVLVLLFSAVPVAVTNSHHEGTHMTYTEREGTEWLVTHRVTDSVAVSHMVSDKMGLYLQGTRYDGPGFVGFGNRTVPRYFGYRNHTTIGGVVNATPTYVVTKEFDREYYEILPEYQHASAILYTDASLSNLSSDPAVDKIYANGGYAVWFVNQPRANATARPRAQAAFPRFERQGRAASLQDSCGTAGFMSGPRVPRVC